MRLRLNLILALLLIACALAVVAARHQARKLYVELQAAQREARELDIEWGRLLLEQSTWAMHSRIELVARHHLHMAAPEPARIVLLSPAQVTPP
ncbi:MAG: cell division protein FtsL [Thiobacillaceae bacterium]|nr:cell division protein FtsL [Thiobacillaceae bacterium]MCX7672910.1 cell division protein FtsL [Thiobacillaceae bacterium]MDW8322658.1 cell division protein FtsL [Burkholderiales bacterium]